MEGRPSPAGLPLWDFRDGVEWGIGCGRGEVWVARADASIPPTKLGDLALSSFGRGKPLSLCWTADGQVGVAAVAPPVNGPPTPTPAPSASPGAGGASCGLSVMSQNDPTWRDQIMQTGGDPIGGFGCALTSTAMLLNYYGASLTPVQLNGCMGGAADPLVWAEAVRCGRGLGGGGREDFTWQTLDGLLAEGRPAIVGMVHGITGMHFVVVTAGGGDVADNYRIADPWDGPTPHATVRDACTRAGRAW